MTTTICLSMVVVAGPKSGCRPTTGPAWPASMAFMGSCFKLVTSARMQFAGRCAPIWPATGTVTSIGTARMHKSRSAVSGWTRGQSSRSRTRTS